MANDEKRTDREILESIDDWMAIQVFWLILLGFGVAVMLLILIERADGIGKKLDKLIELQTIQAPHVPLPSRPGAR